MYSKTSTSNSFYDYAIHLENYFHLLALLSQVLPEVKTDKKEALEKELENLFFYSLYAGNRIEKLLQEFKSKSNDDKS